jgi:hypothetical protein
MTLCECCAARLGRESEYDNLNCVVKGKGSPIYDPHSPLGVPGQGYSVTPRRPFSMTPFFNAFSVSGVDYSQPEPQKHAILTDFGSDLRQKGGFRGSKYFLKVAMKLKVLQFTFTELVNLI